jgi:hypothetical protein
VRVTSSLLCVSNLERSIDYYQDVLSCKVSIRNREAALLMAPDGFQIYIVSRGPQAQLSSRGIGHQYLIWSVAEKYQLEGLASALRACGSRLDRSTFDGVTYLTARDPDGIRIVVAHPSPEDHPRQLIPPRFFA